MSTTLRKRKIYRKRVKISVCRKKGPTTCRRTTGCKRSNGTKRKFCRKSKNRRIK